LVFNLFLVNDQQLRKINGKLLLYLQNKLRRDVAMAIIGIDLGTTNSAVAYLKNDRAEIIENRNGGRTTPSVVQMNLKGEIVVGQTAKDMYPSLPANTILEVKRLMGTDETVKLGDKEYRPEEISAYILKEIKKSVEDKLGETVTEAVITVPAYFTDAQRVATKKAGQIAGLTVERIINEPTAAAIAYGFDHAKKDQTILVYDLGGGTFDVSVVEMYDSIIEVRSTAGDNHLGGMDFDNLIVEWIVKRVKKESNFDLLGSASGAEILARKARIKDEAEKVKKLLSTQNSAVINIPFIAMNNGVPVNINLELTRHEFEALIKPLAEKTMSEVDRALSEIGLGVSDIHEVLLVGGSTRIPYIQELVQKRFGKAPRKDVNPDEAVALGAAIQAGIKTGKISNVIVTDICPFSLGTDVVRFINNRDESGHFDVLIKKNTTLPAQKSEVYSTVRDYQTAVLVGVYQGENNYVRDNVLIEEFNVDGIPSGLRGQESVEVTFKYDMNGILDVDVKIMSTGKKVTRKITMKEGVMTEAEVQQARQSLDENWDKSELYKSVKPVIQRAERTIEEVDEPSRKKLQQLIDQMKTALSREDAVAVKKIEEQLTDLLIELV
jgi:molecular chaperone DnaK